MARLAVDLGTYSVAALLVDQDGARRRIVVDPETGRPWARSSVARSPDGGWLLGEAAEDIRSVAPDLYRDDLKRLLASGTPVYIGGVAYRVTELIAQVITRCVENARDMTDETVDGLTLGVPVVFEGPRADALQAAAVAAGFRRDRVELVPEPVAVARTALAGTGDGTWLVVDLGGGTLDLALVRTASGQIEVVDAAGDDALGGFLLDEAVVDHLRAEYDLPAADADDSWERADLIVAARSLKHQLSNSDIAYVRNPYGGPQHRLALDRARLTALARPLVGGILTDTQNLLEANDLGWPDIRGAALTGGATRSPAIATGLAARTHVLQLTEIVELATVSGLAGPPDELPRTSATSKRRAVSPKTVIGEEAHEAATLFAKLKGIDPGWVPESLAFSHDGRHLAISSTGGIIRVWDLERSNWRWSSRPSSDGVRGLAFSNDGILLVSGATGDGKNIGIRRADNGRIVNQMSHGGTIWGVSLSPDGTRLVSAGGPTLRVWNPETGAHYHDLWTGALELFSVAFHSEGNDIVTSGCRLTEGEITGLIQRWNAATGTLTWSYEIPEPLWVRRARFSPDGSLVGCGLSTGSALILGASNGDVLWELIAHEGQVFDATFSPDGRTFVTIGADAFVQFWNSANGSLVTTLDSGHTEGARRIEFSPNGRQFATASSDGCVHLWNLP